MSLSFYSAVAWLRRNASQIPEREHLTAKSLPDVVLVSIIQETKTGFFAAPALRDAAMHCDNSQVVQIIVGTACFGGPLVVA